MTNGAATGWEPEQYRRFADQRRQPLEDLIALVHPADFVRAVDLGCGPGEMTARIKERLSIKHLTGIDNSETMLASAARYTQSGIEFEQGDIAHWSAEREYDLVIANASLQWVPDHDQVLARWTHALAPGGQLAVQVPSNATALHHVLAIDLAQREPYLSAFGSDGPPEDVVKANVRTPRHYAAMLYELGCHEQDVSLRVYPHVLPSSRHVVEWAKGTTLTRFKATLPDDLYDDFIADYERELVAALGPREPFFFPFARILMWGQLAA